MSKSIDPTTAIPIFSVVALVVIAGAMMVSAVFSKEEFEAAERKTYNIDWIAGNMIYTKDEQTDLCFAGPPMNNINLSFTVVPCNHKVIRAINNRGEK